MGVVDRLVCVGDAPGRAIDRPRPRIDAGHELTARLFVDESADAAGRWVERGGGFAIALLCSLKIFFKQ